MPGLVTAVAIVGWLGLVVEAIARLTGASVGMELVAAVNGDITGDIPRLEAAMDVVVVVVVIRVEEVVLGLDGEEFSSALLRA